MEEEWTEIDTAGDSRLINIAKEKPKELTSPCQAPHIQAGDMMGILCQSKRQYKLLCVVLLLLATTMLYCLLDMFWLSSSRSSKYRVPPLKKDPRVTLGTLPFLCDLQAEHNLFHSVQTTWNISSAVIGSRGRTDPKQSLYKRVQNSSDTFRGDILKFQIIAKDIHCLQRPFGGDLWRVTMYNQRNKFATSGKVVDHNNGTYSVRVYAGSGGTMTLKFTLVLQREAILWLENVYRKTEMKAAWFGIFKQGKVTEKQNCYIQREGTWDNKCQFPHGALGKTTFLCDPPKSLPCSTLSFIDVSRKPKGTVTKDAVTSNLFKKVKDVLKQQWKENLELKPKLRTYIHFKNLLESEKYLYLNCNRQAIRALACLRLSVLPLKIENGRRRNIPPTESIKKAKVMGQLVSAPLSTNIDNEVLESTDHFTYLGSTITSNLSLDREIDQRIAAQLSKRVGPREGDNNQPQTTKDSLNSLPDYSMYSIPPCKAELPEPLSDGYWLEDRWVSLVCQNRQWKDTNEIQHCLKNKEIYFLGDSTTRQWFQAIVQLIGYPMNDIYLQKKWRERVQSIPNAYTMTGEDDYNWELQDMKNNITLAFRHHALSRHWQIPIHRFPFFADLLNGLQAPQCNYIAVISLWAHFDLWTLESFLDRLTIVKESVDQLMKRCPDTKIVIKGPHERNSVNSHWLLFDMIGTLKQVFRGPGIFFLDIWDMNFDYAYANKKGMDIHMPTELIKEEVFMFLSHVCLK
ncbi:NXPE family member 3-like [Glandiceps talaboti]